MEWIQANWSHIALVIVIIFVIAVWIIRWRADKTKNTTLSKFADSMESIMRSVADKDAVLRQTFRNVEELKKKVKPLVEEGKIPKVGELFKELNEEVGMEDLCRKTYIDSIGPEVGMKKDDGDDTVFFEPEK